MLYVVNLFGTLDGSLNKVLRGSLAMVLLLKVESSNIYLNYSSYTGE